MAISTNTPPRLLLDAGDLTVGGTDIGATGTEGTFGIEQELYFPEFGGARGFIAGTGKVITEKATLQVTLKEVSVQNLVLVLPTLSSSSDATSEYTVQENLGAILAAAHKTVIWNGALLTGKKLQIQLLNALPAGGLSMVLNDKQESAYEVTFETYYSTSDAKKRPWVVYKER